MRPPPATIGPYVVERVLGQGGMGVVYVCRHPALPRPVAVKQVLARGADTRTLQRFEREAALMARLKHPAVVAVHELGHTPDGPYIVMELVEGRGLDRAAREGVLTPDDAARITRDLALAVAALHAVGVIHRDIKPTNVLRRADGAPVLLDFGLARELAADRLTRTGEVLGTVAYMPPEQADGRNAELDERVDVYSLGALLYELLAGRPPYEGGGIQVIAQVLGPEDPPPPSAAGRPVPPGLEAIVRTAMAKRREERYPTARALAADLSRYLAGEPPAAAERAPTPRRAHVLAALAALAMVAIGGVSVASALRPGPAAVDAGVTEAPPAEAPSPPPSPAAPEVAPLWVVAVGQELEYDLEFEETGEGRSVRFGCRLALRRVERRDVDDLAFACVVRRLSCNVVIGGLENQEFSSERPDRSHPLSFLGDAVDQTFECRLDPRTGEVHGMLGFDAIREHVRRERLSAGPLDGFADVVLDDDFMGASMNALTSVRSRGSVPWSPAPSSDAGLFVVEDASAPVVLPSLTLGPEAADEFHFTGRATYAGGGVERSQLQQHARRDGSLLFVTTWSMTRSR